MGSRIPVHGVTVDGVVYVTWWSLQPLAPSLQFGVAGDRVILQRKPVGALKASPETATAADWSGGGAGGAQPSPDTASTVRTDAAGGAHPVCRQRAAYSRRIAHPHRWQGWPWWMRLLPTCSASHRWRPCPSAGTHGLRQLRLQTGPVGSTIGHVGTDGSTVADRVSRYGKWQITAGENIDYGYSEAGDIVSALIIDDGVVDRGHCTNIFKAEIMWSALPWGRIHSTASCASWTLRLDTSTSKPINFLVLPAIPWVGCSTDSREIASPLRPGRGSARAAGPVCVRSTVPPVPPAVALWCS